MGLVDRILSRFPVRAAKVGGGVEGGWSATEPGAVVRGMRDFWRLGYGPYFCGHCKAGPRRASTDGEGAAEGSGLAGGGDGPQKSGEGGLAEGRFLVALLRTIHLLLLIIISQA